MPGFPRTKVGGVSLSRMIIGTNWFLGFSHQTEAKDTWIESYMDRTRIADILEVFLNAGVDTIMGLAQRPLLQEAIAEARDRTGKRMIIVSTPAFKTGPTTPSRGFKKSEVEKVLDAEVKAGSTFCMPHSMTTDALLDKCTRTIRHMDTLCRMIRERGLIPGLSCHAPEAIIYADETDLDVETYIAMYNSMGFLMHVEVDWVASVIRNSHHPVMTIKPFAAGQLRPFQALPFVWGTLRDRDMVTVGTMTPDEAKEVIDLSLAFLEKRQAGVKLQETRSKESIKPKKA